MRAVTLALSLIAASPAIGQDQDFFTLAGGDVNGNYFATARAICSVVNAAELGRMRCSPEATPGSVYNLDALARSEVDFAIVQSDWLVAAHDGTGAFASIGPMDDLRGVLALYDEQITLLAARGSTLAGPMDLIGKRVDLGSPASGRRATATRLLDLMDIAPTRFGTLSELPTAAAIDGLCAGRIDAVILVTGHPDLSVARAIGECGARLVPFIDDRTADAI
ncbi:MAG: TAXI family TRAP transporter solute-binding subunit, partial [Paracoccaceae bacterium]